MIAVLLTVLKILGIVLLVILGLVVLLLLLLLYVPIRYKGGAAFGGKSENEGTGAKVRLSAAGNTVDLNEGSAQAEAAVTWLLRIVSFKMAYRDGKTETSLKLFGLFDLLKDRGEKSPRKKKEISSEVPSSEEKTKPGAETVSEGKHGAAPETVPEERNASSDKDASANETEAEEKKGAPENGDAPGSEKDALPDRILAWIDSLVDRITSIHDRIDDAVTKAEEKAGSAGRTYRFLTEDPVRTAITQIWTAVKKLLVHLFPRKLRGSLHFGTGEPADTGMILGALSVLAPLHRGAFEVEPDFERKTLDGSVRFKGRIFIGYIVHLAVVLILKKEVRYLLKHYKEYFGSSES